MIGDMAMPADFEYRDVFLKGRPVHEPFDAFRLRHPSMDPVRRAKIFAPFDALAGFDEALASTEVLCEPRRELSDDEKEELDRRLGILHRLTRNGHLARENRVPVSVTRFIPFPDGDCGRYETVSAKQERPAVAPLAEQRLHERPPGAIAGDDLVGSGG